MKTRVVQFARLFTAAALLSLAGCSRTVDDVAKWKAAGNAEKLIGALADPKYEVRLEAAAALGELQAGQAVDDLAALYNDPEEDVIRTAVTALAAIGSPATVTPLTAALKLSDPETRLLAAETLGSLQAVGAVSQLAEALDDSEAAVQLAAAAALGEIGDASGSAGLAGKLNDASAELRRTCAAALGRTGGETGTAALLGALADSDAAVAETAKASLIEIGEPALPAVLLALRHEEKAVRAGALAILRKHQAVPESGADLIWYQLARVSVDAEPGIDDGVVKNLVKTGPDAADTLLEAAAHPVSDFREHALYALGQLGEPVLEKTVAAAEAKAGPAGKKWFAARGSWPGAPSWRIDLWAAAAALNPAFSPDRSMVSSLQMQARPAYNVLQDPQFTLTREYVPDLIVLLGDTTEPAPEEPEYDAQGMPVIKAKRDLFSGELNRRAAAEMLRKAGDLAVLPLIAAVEDDHELIAGSAAAILGSMGEKRALEPLMHVVRRRLEAGAVLTDSPFYTALQQMDDPEAEPLLLQIRPNADRAMQVFARKYTDTRPISAETKGETEDLTQPVHFRIGYIDRGRVGEAMISFARDDAGRWVPNPALPDQPPAM